MTKPKRRFLSLSLLIAFVLAAFAAPFTAGATMGSRFGFGLEAQDDFFHCAEHDEASEYDETDDSKYTAPVIDPGCGCTTANGGTYTTDTDNGRVRIRSDHDLNSSIVGYIPYGATFNVSVASSTWAHVTYGGKSGYASMTVIKKVSDAPNQNCDCSPANGGTYTTDTSNGRNVNIRRDHDLESNVIGSIPYGSTFNVSAAGSAWAHVNYNNKKGYVHLSVIKKVTPTPTPTPTPKPTPTPTPAPTPTPTPAPILFGDNIPMQLNVGESKIITVKNYPSSALQWKASNPRVVSINENTGKVTANACGKITITVSLRANSSVFARRTLTVNPATTETYGIDSGCVYMIKNVSRNMYLSAAASGTGVALAAKNEMDGRQLWYVEWTGSGYKLYSMGHKDTASAGRYESLLHGCEKNKTPDFKREGLSGLVWSIHMNGKVDSVPCYYLTNTVALYRNTSVSAKSSGTTVSCIDLANESSYARWQFKEIKTETFNNYWGGGYYGVDVDTGDTLYLKVNVDWGSVDDSNGIYKSEHFNILNNANNPWNGLSQNVVIYGPDDDVPGYANPFVVTIKCIPKIDRFNPAGKMFPLDNHGSEMDYDPFLSETWYGATIKLSTEQAVGLTDIDKQKIILHELGHALKLAHTFDSDTTVNVPNGRPAYPGSNSVCSIMNWYNPTENSNLACVYPKKHDIINLINKWN